MVWATLLNQPPPALVFIVQAAAELDDGGDSIDVGLLLRLDDGSYELGQANIGRRELGDMFGDDDVDNATFFTKAVAETQRYVVEFGNQQRLI